MAGSALTGAKANAKKVGSNIGAAGSFVKSGAQNLAGQTSKHAQNLAGSVNIHAQNLAGSVNMHAQNLGKKFISAVQVSNASALKASQELRMKQFNQPH